MASSQSPDLSIEGTLQFLEPRVESPSTTTNNKNNVSTTTTTTTTTRKIAPSLTLINSSIYYKRQAKINDAKILAIHESLHKSGMLFIISLYCFVKNLNDTVTRPKQTIENKMDMFIKFYLEIFQVLPFLGEIELSREEFEIVLLLFDEFFMDYNFITLCQTHLKNRGKLQQAIAGWFKLRGIVMKSNGDFIREVLSAGLNDWFLHLQR
ncbi:hypothetical protein KGF56_004607 [Candida oxycetoniae]|uniref:Uncharacterized protein n=1 Tax=Candida oxycetoniae TaxID=497107 RepID=A0AAI9WVQ6_9ASCO|nr:uncharacterized protein KGF56_004607 [Candida oxycetoniae]KAI3402515.2 hypothetical protein KGF56_004607 [Candida oxycetoniae]